MVKSPVENCVFDHTWSVLDERLLEASREAILEAEEKVREVSQKEVACKHCQKVIGQFVPDPESLTVATSYASCVFCPGKMFIQTPLGHRLSLLKGDENPNREKFSHGNLEELEEINEGLLQSYTPQTSEPMEKTELNEGCPDPDNTIGLNNVLEDTSDANCEPDPDTESDQPTQTPDTAVKSVSDETNRHDGVDMEDMEDMEAAEVDLNGGHFEPPPKEKIDKNPIWANFLVNQSTGQAKCNKCCALVRMYNTNKNGEYSMGKGKMREHLDSHECSKLSKAKDLNASIEASENRLDHENLSSEKSRECFEAKALTLASREDFEFPSVERLASNNNWEHFLIKESEGLAMCRHCSKVIPMDTRKEQARISRYGLLLLLPSVHFCLPHGRPRCTSFPSSSSPPGDFLLFLV